MFVKSDMKHRKKKKKKVYFLRFELYTFFLFMTAIAMPFYFNWVSAGRGITIKQACLPWQSVTLVNGLSVLYTNTSCYYTKISTYIHDSVLKSNRGQKTHK